MSYGRRYIDKKGQKIKFRNYLFKPNKLAILMSVDRKPTFFHYLFKFNSVATSMKIAKKNEYPNNLFNRNNVVTSAKTASNVIFLAIFFKAKVAIFMKMVKKTSS